MLSWKWTSPTSVASSGAVAPSLARNSTSPLPLACAVSCRKQSPTAVAVACTVPSSYLLLVPSSRNPAHVFRGGASAEPFFLEDQRGVPARAAAPTATVRFAFSCSFLFVCFP